MGILEIFRWRSRSRFEQLVEQHSAPIYSYAIWLTGDRCRAEDLVQEVFIRAWQHFNQLQEPKACRSWLLTILRREHLRWLAKQANGHNEVSLTREQADPTTLDEQLQRDQLQQAILALEPGYLEPILLQVLGGYSISEISGELGLSESAVQSRLYRARQQLLRQLAPNQKATRRMG
ncbi:sigma-70 family RNA polymerase sigma factor [Marinobacterium arenosum]|uniref:sigma-70 family RNA polymerase sigma factor n=1 Tax=Marinobacterium arenosum TaxID=2862496 RepID=UPI001C9703EC|nr:sigma-70 family RNA polymerase sigma factor [Marinobacterium arenosum]MBY4678072.1 sigma-70 family RNA polymerase sigma factor [Marinobacterium arenosum]